MKFNNKEEALKARRKAELKYFGGFAPMREGERIWTNLS